jgi:hypothetical protein
VWPWVAPVRAWPWPARALAYRWEAAAPGYRWEAVAPAYPSAVLVCRWGEPGYSLAGPVWPSVAPAMELRLAMACLSAGESAKVVAFGWVSVSACCQLWE